MFPWPGDECEESSNDVQLFIDIFADNVKAAATESGADLDDWDSEEAGLLLAYAKTLVILLEAAVNSVWASSTALVRDHAVNLGLVAAKLAFTQGSM